MIITISKFYLLGLFTGVSDMQIVSALDLTSYTNAKGNGIGVLAGGDSSQLELL